ncbi:conserved hypothetical protein [Rippkaea orientalis PCC 8801]|uniref:Uncharacterized protein n=1 Tax=Rippkaea orientalis (strain PCC 8801 / RF-1) TaxID=41431 RepID=B7K195_RIPO1|nr:hypothetical protein [Rippkaea orientalis]ACK66290.1 conserved hypothetical protein [Rippkaea orientalis PCC 8801]
MKASTIRQLWCIVEESAGNTLMSLNDSELVTQLLQKLDAKHPLSSEDWYLMKNYLSSRTLLIREIAQYNSQNSLYLAVI